MEKMGVAEKKPGWRAEMGFSAPGEEAREQGHDR